MANFSTYKPTFSGFDYPTKFNGAMDELDARFNTAASFLGTVAIAGALALSSTLSVTGTSALNGTVTVGGGTGSPFLHLNGAASGSPAMVFDQAGTQRGYFQYDNSLTSLTFGIGLASASLTIGASTVTAAGDVLIGSSPASAGTIRLADAAKLAWKTTGSDYVALRCNAGAIDYSGGTVFPASFSFRNASGAIFATSGTSWVLTGTLTGTIFNRGVTNDQLILVGGITRFSDGSAISLFGSTHANANQSFYDATLHNFRTAAGGNGGANPIVKVAGNLSFAGATSGNAADIWMGITTSTTSLGFNVPTGMTYRFLHNNSDKMNITTDGVWIGTTTLIASGYSLTAASAASSAALFQCVTAATEVCAVWNATTSGDGQFIRFYTESGGATARGLIDYNRAGGLTRYGTTSDYRLKNIHGLFDNSGEMFDNIPVHWGTMKGATQSRPMFLAHEVQAYLPWAVSGSKDGPVHQMLSESSLVPALWAEVKSLRRRVKQLEGAAAS